MLKNNKKGILFRIPILLFFCGFLIIGFSGWKLIKQIYFLESAMVNVKSTQSDDKIPQKKYVINNKTIVRPSLGSTFGEIKIPSVSLDYPLIHGDRPEDLEKGVGHFAGSTLPGEGGNVIVDGHRDTAFRKLKDIKVGDIVTITTSYGTFDYKVNNIRITDPDDRTVIVASKTEMLTMYTCYPFNYIGHAPKRYVVTADFIKK